jgi:prefoldin subunit 5
MGSKNTERRTPVKDLEGRINELETRLSDLSDRIQRLDQRMQRIADSLAASQAQHL